MSDVIADNNTPAAAPENPGAPSVTNAFSRASAPQNTPAPAKQSGPWEWANMLATIINVNMTEFSQLHPMLSSFAVINSSTGRPYDRADMDIMMGTFFDRPRPKSHWELEPWEKETSYAPASSVNADADIDTDADTDAPAVETTAPAAPTADYRIESATIEGDKRIYSGTDRHGNTFTIERAGHAAFANNNPLGVPPGELATAYGAIGVDEASGQAIFASPRAGYVAGLANLQQQPEFATMTVADLVAARLPVADGADSSIYIRQVAQGSGVEASTKLSELSPTGLAKVSLELAKAEGWQKSEIKITGTTLEIAANIARDQEYSEPKAPVSLTQAFSRGGVEEKPAGPAPAVTVPYLEEPAHLARPIFGPQP